MDGQPPDIEPNPQSASLRLSAGRASLILALAAGALLVAAKLDIGMAGAWLHPTPRVNSLTVGLGLVPLLAIAVTTYLWAAPHPAGGAATAARVIGTVVAVAAGGLSLFASLFLAWFVG